MHLAIVTMWGMVMKSRKLRLFYDIFAPFLLSDAKAELYETRIDTFTRCFKQGKDAFKLVAHYRNI